MLKNVVDPDRPQMAIRRMRFTCWIPRVTDAHSEYEIMLFHATVVVRTRPSVTLYVCC